MKKIIYAWIIAVVLCTLCDAQFFYNDDQEQPPENTYAHNNPPVQVRQSPRPQRPINYQPAPQAPQPVAAEYEQRPTPSRPRRPQNQVAQLQPPRRVYSPSVFENVALGMPPAGVYVPDDSFLNVLRNDGRSARPRPAPAQELVPPQQTSFVQSPPAQHGRFAPAPPDRQTFAQSPPPRQTFVQAPPARQPAFVQSPPARQPAFVQSPPARQPAFVQSPPAQSYPSEPAVSHRPRAVQAPPSVVRHQPLVQRPQPVAVHSQVQDQAPYEPVEAPPQPVPRRRSGSRQRPVPRAQSYEEQPQRPRVYSPSVFENLDLGIAPQGIHVPEDSLLNILRSDRPVARSRRNQGYQLDPPAPLPVQHLPAQPLAEQPAPIQTYSTNAEIPREIHNPQPPAPRRVNPPPQQQRPQQKFVVDNAPNYQSVEEQPQVVQPPTPVQHRRRVSVRRHRQSSGTRPRQDPELEEISQPPKQYGPSVFEKFALGEAPPGIYVPEDSFLNLLRGDVPVSRASQRPSNQRSRAPQYAPQPPPPPPPQQYASDVSDVQNYPEPDYGVQHETPRRRSRISHTNQPSPPLQQYQNVPAQEYEPRASVQPRRRPAVQEIQQPAIVPRPAQPPKRQRQRSRAEQISAPQYQQVQEVSAVVYHEDSNSQQEDDILRRRPQNTNQRTQQQVHAPQRQRVEPAPRYAPPPQPVYETPDPIYDTDSSFQQTDDISRRRPQPNSQRRAQVQPQPVQQVHTPSGQVPPQHSEPRQQGRQRAAKLSVKPLPEDVDGDQIPGEAGVDYPTFHVIPRTSFSCAEQLHNGYYADLDTSCQVMHVCQAGGVQSSFLCPNGTIFNQEKFSCQWWYKVNCAEAPSHYGINDRLYKVPPPAEPSRRRNK